MDVELAYGDDKIRLTLPDTVTVDEYAPVTVGQPPGREEFLSGLNESDVHALSSDDILIVVNDAHRNTPTALVLTWLEEVVPGLLGRASFLVACGTHAIPDENQLSRIFGEHLSGIADRISCHDCDDSQSMKSVGSDHFGCEVRFNRMIFEHEAVFIINSVEPHYFAGYTGGRKSLTPGLADRATIERNHNMANSLEAAPLKLEGNPVAEHLYELLKMLDYKKFLTVQIVLDASVKPAAFFWGNIDDAFNRATRVADQVFARKIDRQYNAVLMEIAPPLDRSLYQIQKGLENNRSAVKSGGAAVLISACHDGVGNREFYDLANKWDFDTNKSNDGKLHFGSHKLSRVIGMRRDFDVFVHSEVEDSDVRQVFYEPLDDIQAYLDTKISESSDYTVGVVHDAGSTVLKFEP